MILATDDKEAAEFLNGIIPRSLIDAANDQLENDNKIVDISTTAIE